jgi:hypothetical protein
MKGFGRLIGASVVMAMIAIALPCLAQSLPVTAGETLSGKRIVLADAVHGQATILVAGFSHASGTACGNWMKAIRADSALNGGAVYEVAEIEGAPGIFRGTIKNAMKKGLSADEQERFVVLTQDAALWKKFFDVSNDGDAYVVLLDAKGGVVWRGHGTAEALEPQVRRALHP